MQFSDTTLQILKSFAGLNTQMFFKPGNVIRTVNESKTILVEATIDESIPVEFALYDLGNFLSVLSLDEQSTLEISTTEIKSTSQDAKTNLVYRCCDPQLIKNPFERNISLPTNDYVVSLTEKDILWAQKTGSVLQSPQIALISKDGHLSLDVLDSSNDSASYASRRLSTPNVPASKAIFKAENWRLIPGDYTVTISLKGISHFQHTTKKIQYWMSLETGSKRSK